MDFSISYPGTMTAGFTRYQKPNNCAGRTNVTIKREIQENIDALHQWRLKSVVSEIEHITTGYNEYSNRVTLKVQFTQFFCC